MKTKSNSIIKHLTSKPENENWVKHLAPFRGFAIYNYFFAVRYYPKYTLFYIGIISTLVLYQIDIGFM